MKNKQYTDIYYGRVVPVRSTLGERRASLRMVTVAWWSDDRRKPFYALENEPYMQFWTDEGEYRVYNPLKLNFDANRLSSVIAIMACQWETPARDFNIVKPRSVSSK